MMAAVLDQSNQMTLRDNQSVGFTTMAGFEFVQRVAKMLASSALIPKEYQGSVANCAIALNMASRIGADPLQVMQSLVIVHGRPTWSAQFLIACFNQCGRYTSIKYRFTGEKGKDSYGCIAYAQELSTGETIESSEITIGIAKAEGWYGRNGSKWQTIGSHMLMLRSASWLVRTHAPELAMGLTTREEAIDSIDLERSPDGSFAAAPAVSEPEAIMASLDPQTGEIDPAHVPWIKGIEESQDLGELARVLGAMPRDIKTALRSALETKQASLKAQEGAA
jgi:hypothetical protein